MTPQLLLLDDELVGHVALALELYRRRLRDDALTGPSALLELGDLVTAAAMRGRARTTLAEKPAELEARLMPLLLTPGEAAKVLRVSERTVRRLAAAGKLTPVSIGGSTRYRSADVEAYVSGLGHRPMQERLSVKSSVGSGRVRARGSVAPGPDAEHEGAA